MKKVSVIIPVLNGEKYIADAIQSVQSQDYENIELIVCNGGSTDRTQEIAEDLGCNVVQGKLGIRPNWESALNAATGDYIKLLCHDDTLRGDCISRQAAELDKDPSLIMVSCQRQYIDEYGTNLEPLILQNTDKKISGSDITRLMLMYGNLVGETTCTLFRKTSITFPSDLNWLVDMYMWAWLFKRGDYLYIADLLANIRLHDGQDTHRVLKDPDYEAKEASDKKHILRIASE